MGITHPRKEDCAMQVKPLKLEELSLEQKIGMLITARGLGSKENREFVIEMIKKRALGGLQITVGPGAEKLAQEIREIADYPIDFTPVDECADAYVRLALHDRVNNIYNLYNPHIFTIDTLSRKLFRSIKQVSDDIFEKSLKEFISDREVAVLSFYHAIASSSANVPISNEFTVEELRKLEFKWSKITLRYLSYINKL